MSQVLLVILMVIYILGNAGGVRQSACYSLTGSSWKEEHGLLVTGGWNGNGDLLSSTEYLSASGQWTPGPVLPVAMWRHCQVTAGSDVIITGGFGNILSSDYEELTSAYKLSADGSSWIQLPSMATARFGHACVVHQDYLYAIGGAGAYSSVEKMKLTSLTKWETGPELDTSFYGGQAIVYQDTLFLVYKEGKVVKLNTEDKWEKVTDLVHGLGDRPVFPAPIVTPWLIGC